MKILKGILSVLVVTLLFSFPVQVLNSKTPMFTIGKSKNLANSLYTDLHLKELGLDLAVFETALEGHQKLVHENKLAVPNLMTIVDLSQPSTNKRLYIVDLEKAQVLFNTYVSHGKNSGDLFATHFSNIPSSLQSSLGFYVTGDIYNGKHGMSLKLNGQEPGFNDLALARAIVLHGADYVSENFIKSTGRLGRSFGCPAVSSELAAPIINTIQNGSCLFVYSPDPAYLKKSLLACADKN